ncbi:olfactory receptor 14A16-like [Tachyglossus aculeatus]|uniref:olfactory receptor 14A16-like n=1 Tax=Tachyglossus aculeatus TaxID=9261 RepID=UPI0018F34094|nr:olfactory receptor 14A16-like [Tachyglossus aculeatus]
MSNITTMTEFILLGFSEVQELQLVHAALFLLVYLAALMGNLLIVAVTTLDRRLHTPMYFFLRNLSLIDLCFISTTVPKSILNSLSNRQSISFLGCVSQVFSYLMFAATDLIFLTVMSYDRYVAICCPLRYYVTMDQGACWKMVVASWLGGGLYALMNTTATFSCHLCGPRVIHQFFCDIPQLLKLICPGEAQAEISALAPISGGLSYLDLLVSVFYALGYAAPQ